MIKRLLLTLPLLLLLWTCCSAQQNAYLPEEGDFVFQSFPRSELTDTIEGVTRSHYSHVGLLVRKNDRWYVREAIGPVTDTPWPEWVARGRGQAFDAFRLRRQFRTHIPGLIRASATYLGRPYDSKYELDDEKIYCSELIYKAMLDASGIALGKLQKLGDLNWQPYRLTIEKYEGGKPPLNRLMISPQSLSEANELEKVHRGYP